MNQNDSQEYLNNISNTNTKPTPQFDARSNSYDQIQNKQFSNQFNTFDSNNRSLSQNGLDNYNENINPGQAFNAYRPSNPEMYNQIYPPPPQIYSAPQAAIDPSLSAILSRPPVGYKPQPLPPPQPAYHYPQDYNQQQNDFRFQANDFNNQQNFNNTTNSSRLIFYHHEPGVFFR